jgi:hypothetical protein
LSYETLNLILTFCFRKDVDGCHLQVFCFVSPLAQENKLSLELVYTCIFRKLGYLALSWVYEVKIKPRNSLLWVLRLKPISCFSLPFRIFLCLFYIQCPWNLAVFSRRNREKYVYSIFQVQPYFYGQLYCVRGLVAVTNT